MSSNEKKILIITFRFLTLRASHQCGTRPVVTDYLTWTETWDLHRQACSQKFSTGGYHSHPICWRPIFSHHTFRHHSLNLNTPFIILDYYCSLQNVDPENFIVAFLGEFNSNTPPPCLRAGASLYSVSFSGYVSMLWSILSVVSLR